MIEVSIVIPTYRRREPLARALASCLAQRDVGVPFEIVVVDNDTEGSARPVVEAAAAGAHVPIRYRVECRPGISHARNTGVAHAAGRNIAFLDDDEEAEPGWLAAFLAAKQRFRADVVAGPVYPLLPDGAARSDGYDRFVYTRDAGLPTGARLRRWSKCNALFDRERCFAGAVAPFDPRLGLSGGEDSLFLRQLIRQGRSIVWCAEAVIWETIPREKVGERYLLRRTFRGAQSTTFVCLAVEPAEPLVAAFWMLLGCAQVALYAGPALLLFALRHRRWLAVAAKAAGGLGKVMWHPRLHLRLYR